jgi:tRNA A-37 threonylcarbamoyl transferase component Bud32
MTQARYNGLVLDGKYRVQELLGEGGMGAVYRGEHMLIGRQVAIKFLHESLLANEEAVKRFYREGQAAASIGHRNVIDVLDVGVSAAGDPYMVMEYLEGEGLADLVARTGPLDLAVAAGILEQVLSALGAAHERGIVHRDLKPDNVFLERQRGGAPGIKLIDFGISKLAAEGAGTALTRDGSMMGTPAYMSPEQIRNSKAVDHRTDVYAAGAIFYEMLAGAPPFDGEHYSEILSAVLTGPPRDPRELRADFPPEAWPFIERAMAKDPAARFGSADEMLAALAGLVAPEERAVHLTLLGAAMPAGTCAVGDLGPAGVATGDTVLATEILGRMVEERAGVPAWKRLARRVAAGLRPRFRALGALIAASLKRLARRVAAGLRPRFRALGALIAASLKRLARRVIGEPRMRLRAAVVAGAALLVVLLVALCSGGEATSTPGGEATSTPGGEATSNPVKKPRGADASRPEKQANHEPEKVEAGRLGESGAPKGPEPGSPSESEVESEKKSDSKPTRKKRKFPRLPWQK